ncbi:MCE family protein [Mycolicibacterium thermoresistibile]
MMFLVKLIDLGVSAILFLFRGEERHNPRIPFILGSIGTAALVAILLISVGVPRMVYHHRTHAYTAELANASGLTQGDPVYVAGVPAGRVEQVRLAKDHVHIDFRLDRAQQLGNRTTATVRLRTVLGKRFLDVMPAGAPEPDSRDTTVIPLSRTTVPYSLDDVGRQAEVAADGIEQQSLAAMMRTLAESMPGDNADLHTALAGVSTASAAFARSGEQLDEILRIARSMSDGLTRQTDMLTATAANVQRIVAALAARRQALTQIIDNLGAVLDGLATVYTDKREDFAALTRNLVEVTETLRANVARIDQTMETMPPAIRAVVNATGNGTWADVSSPSLVMPDNLLCALNLQRECR